ncbi:MAG: hypothetical protein GW886_12640 [Rhodobacterales bacterium]|nr:hypothetical protein [Rhodobacterales bacterium]NCT12133.1 hypothetical protein [Rhodobacterales bacterium]
MNKVLTAGAALMLGTTLAHAGGLDRSGQPIGLIFEEGNAIQFTFSSVTPSVSGVSVGPGLGTGGSGNMAASYTQLGFGIKYDINDQFSVALLYDQPFGANVDYDPAAAYYAAGSVAVVESTALTGVLRYRLNENFSVHGGVRYQTVNAAVSKPRVAGYDLTTEASSATGYLVGAAYERPDIALRVALTYNSAITHDIVGTETCAAPLAFCAGTTATTSVDTPQSINLDFQTGVAANTLVFGSIRWAQWTAFDYAPPVHAGLGRGSLQSYDDDTISYSIGVGRRFNDQWSGALTVGYEAPQGGFAGDLAPVDGQVSLGLGATYTGEGFKVTAGVRQIWLGDATTEHPTLAGVDGAEFTGNTATAFGLQFTTSF